MSSSAFIEENDLIITKDGIDYEFTIDWTGTHQGVYINNKFELIIDILKSIKIHYNDNLRNNIDLNEDEFIFIYNIYKESICQLQINILKVYNRTELIKKNIDSNISRLIMKPLQFVVYESSWCNEELLLPQMLRIQDIINRDITLEQIILDIYEHEISRIDNKIINCTLEIHNELLALATSQIDFISPEEILKKIIEDFKYNEIKKQKLKDIFSFKIYEYLNMYKNINEANICKLYDTIDIKYVKIIIDIKDNNVVWIMRKLNMLTNKFIPVYFIDKSLDNIIKLNKNDNIVTIKYNKDSSTSSQLTSYLIDSLYKKLMEQESQIYNNREL